MWADANFSLICMSQVADHSSLVPKQGLGQALEASNSTFVLDLASLASSRSLLNLESWLSERMRAASEEVGTVCLDFLAKKMNTTPAEVVGIFLRVLNSFAG